MREKKKMKYGQKTTKNVVYGILVYPIKKKIICSVTNLNLWLRLSKHMDLNPRKAIDAIQENP